MIIPELSSKRQEEERRQEEEGGREQERRYRVEIESVRSASPTEMDDIDSLRGFPPSYVSDGTPSTPLPSYRSLSPANSYSHPPRQRNGRRSSTYSGYNYSNSRNRGSFRECTIDGDLTVVDGSLLVNGNTITISGPGTFISGSNFNAWSSGPPYDDSHSHSTNPHRFGFSPSSRGGSNSFFFANANSRNSDRNEDRYNDNSRPTNFVRIDEPCRSIRRNFTIDPYLHIPAKLSSPLPPEGRDKQPNVLLKTDNGSMNVDIRVLGPGSSVVNRTGGDSSPSETSKLAGGKKQVEFVLKGDNGSILANFHDASSDRPPYKIKASNNNGTCRIRLPRSFTGHVTVNRRNGSLRLSSEFKKIALELGDFHGTKEWFIGDSNAANSNQDSLGDELHVSTVNGSTEIAYVDEDTDSGWVGDDNGDSEPWTGIIGSGTVINDIVGNTSIFSGFFGRS